MMIPLAVQILDFSPEWDYTTGGSKVLFCIKPGIDAMFESSPEF
jgi:hypothetical protein